MKRIFRIAALAVALMAAVALTCGAQGAAGPATPRLRLATTTSTEQSGLLASILPAFEKKNGLQGRRRGRRHGGFAQDRRKRRLRRRPGPRPSTGGRLHGLGLRRRAARRHVQRLRRARPGIGSRPCRYGQVGDRQVGGGGLLQDLCFHVPFVSRGDKSGTDVKEKEIWKASGLAPAGAPWYKEIGQGMSQAILMAEQIGGYTLADRATWLSMKAKSSLSILSQGDKILFNPYGIISVSPAKWPRPTSRAPRR